MLRQYFIQASDKTNSSLPSHYVPACNSGGNKKGRKSHTSSDNKQTKVTASERCQGNIYKAAFIRVRHVQEGGAGLYQASVLLCLPY